ncbi:hypothetical protein FB446DRAFT_721807 [Lentinula raphanica]|nr:hypothetical protein FB446DRAFT_721807 [Lentinula raphanica]
MSRALVVTRRVARQTSPTTCRRLSSASSINPLQTSSPRKARDPVEASIGFDESSNAVRVNFWHAPRDPADILATVQYIEQLYGPIDEFRSLSTNDLRKSTTMLVKFRASSSASLATSVTESHRIAVPKIPRPDPLQGGIGLASLEPLLDTPPHKAEDKPQLFKPDLSEKYDRRKDPFREFLYFQILTANNVRSPPIKADAQYLRRPAMGAFVRWSGFSAVEPRTPAQVQEDTVDHPIMRHVVTRYANMLGMHNPFEKRPQKEATSAAKTWVAPSKQPAQTHENSKEEDNLVPPDDSIPPSIPVSDQYSNSPSVDAVNVEAAGVVDTSPALPSTPPSTPTPAPSIQSLDKSPEAIAQLRIANSILKNIQKPNKAKNQRQPQAQVKGNPPPTQRPKGLQHRPSAAVAASASASLSSKGQSASNEVKGEAATEGNMTSKLKGFMGNWF